MSYTYNYPNFNVSFPSDGVAVVQIDRQDALNAFFEQMWLDYKTIIDTLAKDPACRVIVLTAAGDKAFTTGLDIKKAGFIQPTPGKPQDVARRGFSIRSHMMEFQDCITAGEKCLKPIITVLHGYAFGLGIDMSTATDIRICTADVKFSVREVDIGIAADVGTLQRLPKVVGSTSWVKDICLTARIFGAEEALKQGFVSEVYPTKAAALAGALEKAVAMSAKSPVAVQSTKEVINYSMDHPISSGLKYIAAWNSGMLQTEDTSIAVKSILAKTTPKFSKL